MQNSYTKKGQLSWWLALLWFHKGRGLNPLPFKTENCLNFYPNPLARLEDPRALYIPRPGPGR